MVDVEGEKHCMEAVSSWTYLGDVIQSNGKNDLNIQERVGKGIGAVKQITQMLSDLCLGPYYYEAFSVLRSSLLLSSLISNSESWVGLTKSQISDLEAVDEELFRNIFPIDQEKAHSKTALELFYLETGSIPIRYILMSRRLNFLWYLVHQKEDSLLHNFFRAQCDDPIKGDWVSQVKEDMKCLSINMSVDDLKLFSKDKFKELVKKHVRAAAFSGLKEIQETHSKSMKLEYKEMMMQGYLSPISGMTNKEKSFAFSARAQMLKGIKNNFRQGQSDIKCSLGCDKTEDQEHLLQCPALSDNEEIQANYNDIYSDNMLKIRKITQILMKKFTKFTTLKSTVHGQSPKTESSAAESEDKVNDVNDIVDPNIVNVSDLELE